MTKKPVRCSPTPPTSSAPGKPVIAQESSLVFANRRKTRPEYVHLHEALAGLVVGEVIVQTPGPRDTPRRLFNRLGSAVHRCPTPPPEGFRFSRRLLNDGRVGIMLRPVFALPSATVETPGKGKAKAPAKAKAKAKPASSRKAGRR